MKALCFLKQVLLHSRVYLYFHVLVSLFVTMTTEDKRLSNGSYNAGIEHDTTASTSLPTSTSRESIAYRQHVRKESQARERAQHDALMDDYTPDPVTPTTTNARTEQALSDQHHPRQEEASQPHGFAKLLQKIGLKK